LKCRQILTHPKSYVEVHRAGKPAEIKYEDDVLSGDHVLPNFTLAVKDIFR